MPVLLLTFGKTNNSIFIGKSILDIIFSSCTETSDGVTKMEQPERNKSGKTLIIATMLMILR